MLTLPYTIPNTTTEVHKVLPGVHVSPETAYVVDDYPYGFRLRCAIRFWLDVTKSGTRLLSQTTNPKKPGIVWNKPKASTYAKFGGAMFLDQTGHVKWSGLHEYQPAAASAEWLEVFADGVPEATRRLAENWVKATTLHVFQTRILTCAMPTCISYSDRKTEIDGDYKRLASLFYDTLELQLAADCPEDLRPLIVRDAAKIQARRGEQYQVSASGQTVLLGGTT